MAVDLADYVLSLQREVQPPGTTIFDGVSGTQWTGYLTDAFWEARLDGFMEGYIADEDGIVTSVDEDAPDLAREEVSLVILYAGIKVLRNQILNMPTGFRAKAGPVEFEQQNSATMLAEMLKQLRLTKDRIIEQMEDDNLASAVMLIDAYSVRLFSPQSYYGSPELTG